MSWGHDDWSWPAGSGDHPESGVVEAEWLLANWFGGDRSGWPALATVEEVCRWLIAYPDPVAGSRIARSADFPSICAALRFGVSHTGACRGQTREWKSVWNATGEDDPDLLAAARSKRTPPGLLREILETASDPNSDPLIKRLIAANPSTPPDVLTKLANSSALVRDNLLRNPSTPPETLLAIVKSGPTYSQVLPVEVVDRYSDEMLAAMAAHRDVEMRLSVLGATRPLPLETLRRLERSSEQKVRQLATYRLLREWPLA